MVVEEAVKLAQVIDGRIVLLHIMRPIQAAAGYELDSQHVGELNATMELEAERRLGSAKAALQQRGIPTQALRLTGSPLKEILDQAEKLQATYIVMGALDRAVFCDPSAGGAAGASIQDARCPVLLVPRPRKAVSTSVPGLEPLSRLAQHC